MISTDFAKEFSKEWIEAWNSHDLDRILSHYSDDFTIESPLALSRLPETKGIVSGKENVRSYWSIGLSSLPNLRFELLDVLIGVNGLTIYYINTATKRKSAELIMFNEAGKVNNAIVNYSE